MKYLLSPLFQREESRPVIYSCFGFYIFGHVDVRGEFQRNMLIVKVPCVIVSWSILAGFRSPFE